MQRPAENNTQARCRKNRRSLAQRTTYRPFRCAVREQHATNEAASRIAASQMHGRVKKDVVEPSPEEKEKQREQVRTARGLFGKLLEMRQSKAYSEQAWT